MPTGRPLGVAVIGLGAVASNAHIPAYQAAKFTIVAGADPAEPARERAERQLGLPRTTADYRELLEDPQVDIVDVTLPNFVPARLQILEDAIDAGKHVLVQKPFMHNFSDAAAIVARAEAAGVTLAVNQNGRWNPSYRAARALIGSGAIGTPYFVSHDMRIDQDTVVTTPWLLDSEKSILVDYSVHHFDIMRTWVPGRAVGVSAVVGRKPGQRFRGDLIATATVRFENALGLLVDDGASVGDDAYCRFRIEGTEGVINGTVGAWPAGTGRGPGTVEVVRRGAADRFVPELRGNWAIDAFAATMADLMIAVESGTQPEASGLDNLETLRLVFGAEESAATGRTVCF